MDSTHQQDTERITSEMRSILTSNLQKAFLWLRIENLHALVDAQMEELEEKVLAQEQVIADSKSRADFFSLPAELRNRIYEEVLPFVGETVRLRASGKPFYHKTPALLQIKNKAVRSEASSIYYGSNTFVWRWVAHENLEELLKTSLTKWLREMGPSWASRIKELRLVYRQPAALEPDVARQIEKGEWTHPFTNKQLFERLELEKLGMSRDQFKTVFSGYVHGVSGAVEGEIP